jgi:hypothetical protein
LKNLKAPPALAFAKKQRGFFIDFISIEIISRSHKKSY